MKSDIAYVYNKLKQLRFDFKESDRKLFPNEYTFDCSLDRYVRVDGNDLYISKDTFKPLEEELEYADNCHKLEEELGCPLPVVFKAVLRWIYYADTSDNIKREFVDLHTTLDGEYVLLCDNTEEVFFTKDYKKTWWLREDQSE